MATSPCPPIADADWPALIAEMRTGFAGALNVYRTMAHHPELLRAWAPLRQHVVKDSALGAGAFRSGDPACRAPDGFAL